ncbi:hypothetical protein FZEAL_8539 [Fusarium zealandicum]|uniref:Uncharacterized protein n=1 Tax=Fusarium zealandicum TaxID=1053134 RepID=A0A8H4UEB8_9HYPO|nr:hypothetical protein FZEAL_8539 [Fusarium zealandicum]
MSKLVPETKRTLIAALFDRDVVDSDLWEYDDYFESFDAEIQFLNDLRVLRSLGCTFQDGRLVEIALRAAPEMRQTPAAQQGSILDILENDSEIGLPVDGDEEKKAVMRHALDSVVRLWLMIDPAPDETRHRQGWRGERRLCDFVYGLFYPGKPAPEFPVLEGNSTRDPDLAAEMAMENTQLQSSLTHPLTAANMNKLTSITMDWIALIDRHLEFDADYRVLSVFSHNRWLIDALYMVQTWRAKHEPSAAATGITGSQSQALKPQVCPFPIPLEVIEETIKSLNLLFPHYNTPTNRFLRKHNKRLYLFRLRGHGHARDRAGSKVRLREFTFYHDRLIELAQEFINPPKDWNTIFRDYRNPIQYWTFWLGLVIFLATVASVALAAAQVYYGQHSM